jgi:uracil-DNA glycosylase
MVVGEAPGKDEDRTGRPFSGRAGRTLDRLLAEVGLARADEYVANVVMSRPPNNRDPRVDELAACKPYLEIQRQLVQPRVIIALGAFAASGVLGRRVAIKQSRVRVYRRGSALVVATFHPSAIARRSEWRAQAEREFRRAAALLSRSDDR